MSPPRSVTPAPPGWNRTGGGVLVRVLKAPFFGVLMYCTNYGLISHYLSGYLDHFLQHILINLSRKWSPNKMQAQGNNFPGGGKHHQRQVSSFSSFTECPEDICCNLRQTKKSKKLILKRKHGNKTLDRLHCRNLKAQTCIWCV